MNSRAASPSEDERSIVELRRLCGHYRAVPTPCERESTAKESPELEIQKGGHNGELVALTGGVTVLTGDICSGLHGSSSW
jgi:hypothetical protein